MRNLLSKAIGAILLTAQLWVSPAIATPCRPSGADVSRRLSNGSYLQYFPASKNPHVASQSERDCIEWSALNRLAEMMNVFGPIAPNAMSKATSNISLVFTRLSVIPPYEGALQSTSGGTWVLNPFGRHYQIEQASFDAFRGEVTRNPAKAIALLPPGSDLPDVLDTDTSFNAKAYAAFVYPPDMVPPQKWPTSDSKRSSSFVVDTRKKLPPCGGGNCDLVEATHEAHLCGTLVGHCGVPLDKVPANLLVNGKCPSALAAGLAYELACNGDERCEAFRRMKPFKGPEDTRNWNREQLCQIALLQDNEWVEWVKCQKAGDWKCARKHDTNHVELHVAMITGDPRINYVFMCGYNAQDLSTCFGGKQNMQTLLPKLVDYYNIQLPYGFAPTDMVSMQH